MKRVHQLAIAAVIASVSGSQLALGQENFEPLRPSGFSDSSVIIALRPQGQQSSTPGATIPQRSDLVPAAPPGKPGLPETQGASPQRPGGAVIPDGTGKDDKVKTAQDGAAPAGETGGRLAPITMESVRAPIGAADIDVDDIGTKVIPEDVAAKQAPAVMSLPGGADRAFGCLTYRWQAANICHWPLYFEEPMLERHGQQRVPECIQPAVSGTKFLGNVVLYPYKATLWPAFESRYTLGHFRPGSPAPLLRDTLPWSPQAALVQGAAVTGVVVGLPW